MKAQTQMSVVPGVLQAELDRMPAERRRFLVDQEFTRLAERKTALLKELKEVNRQLYAVSKVVLK